MYRKRFIPLASETMSRKIEEQFMKAYDAHQDAIYRHCYFRVFNQETAKDLTQETFMKVWNYLRAGNDIRNIRAFLYKTATNLVIDHHRKKSESSLDEMTESGFKPSTDGDKLMEAQADVQLLLETMQQVDDQYRDVLLLRYVDGFAPKEIAEILGESANVISVRIHRGVKKVKQLLEDKTASS